MIFNKFFKNFFSATFGKTNCTKNAKKSAFLPIFGHITEMPKKNGIPEKGL